MLLKKYDVYNVFTSGRINAYFMLITKKQPIEDGVEIDSILCKIQS